MSNYENLVKHEGYLVYSLYQSLLDTTQHFKFKMLMDQIDYNYFTSEISKDFFKGILELSKSGAVISAHTVIQYINENISTDLNINHLEGLLDIKGFKYVSFIDVLNLVKKEQTKMKLLDFSKSLPNYILTSEKEIGELISEIKESLNKLHITENTIVSQKEAELMALEEMKKQSENGLLQDFITDYKNLDNFLYLNRGQFNILAGRPGMGKTTVAMNVAQNFTNQGYRVLFQSLEMSKKELGKKSVSLIVKDNIKLIIHKFKEKEEKITNLINSYDNGYCIDDSTGINVSDLEAKIEYQKMKGEPIDILIIDYLGLMDVEGTATNRVQEVSKLTRELKLLAKRQNILILCLAQLSRDNEKRADKRPQLSDLRDSGSIEQDADIVMFVYRDYYYSQNIDNKEKLELIVAKHRGGETGTVEFSAKLETNTIQDVFTLNDL
jgi:replicative DNA helicase